MRLEPEEDGKPPKTTTDKNEIPPRSQECRLGLVMYGGVSLAIYIFGVTHEFFNAVRGRGVYRLLKAFTDSDIVVDIMSGTSAGGVNGILLSYALTNDREFSDCSNIWREAADIETLLHGIDDPLHNPADPLDEAKSVLKSKYYQKQLEQALASMRPNTHSEAEDPSPIKELDLFITSTDVDGRVYTWFDDEGHAVDVKDHRAVFILKHRAGRKTPFDPGEDHAVTHQSLATLARLTSCFPVAFRPVKVENVPPQDNGSVDARLQQWGRLGKKAFFLDGGLLDNKPFTHTLREIFYRLADHKVDRKLFYVEPDPERFTPVAPEEPSVLQAAVKSLVTIPSYESIADDLKLLGAHNEKLRRYERLKRGSTANDLPLATRNYLNRLRNPTTAPPAIAHEGPCLYVQARLMELSEQVVRGVLRENGQEVQIDKTQQDKAKDLFADFDRWPGTGEETLRDFDIFFRLRRLFHVLYSIQDPQIGESKKSVQRTAQARIGRQIKLLEVLGAAMQRLVDEATVPWKDCNSEDVWMTVQTAYRRLLHADGLLPEGYESSWNNGEPGNDWLDQNALNEINLKLRKRAAGICEELKSSHTLAPSDDFVSALLTTDICERVMLTQLPEVRTKSNVILLDEYCAFVTLDAQFFPIETLAELGEKDIVDAVRISPFDAQRGFSQRPGAEKISGDELHHFGGFFKRSWRSNDILWGRLDGLCQLVETLFTRERLEQVSQDKNLRERLRKRLASDLAPAALFPRSTPEVQKLLERWLTALFSENKSEREQALGKGSFDKELSRMIEAAQLEVLGQDLPEVINDAVWQQAQWNQYRFSPEHKKQTAKNGKVGFDVGVDAFYVTGPGDLDPLVIAAASERLAEFTSKALAKPTRKMSLARLFRSRYQVGKECVETGIPSLVLMETIAHMLLAVRNAIIATAEDKGDKLRTHPINRWLGFFLRVLYGLSRFMRTTPKGEQFAFFAVTLVSVQALLVGITWWKEIIHPADDFNLRWFVVLVLLPALALAAQAAWLWRRGSGLVRLVLVLILLAAVVWSGMSIDR